ARAGAALAIEETPLLAPKPRAAEYAFHATPSQSEGVAALRYVRPDVSPSNDPTLRNVEVAWDDVLFGHVGHAVIPDAGPFRAGDYGEGKGPARVAHPALFSIAHGGVYLRLHSTAGDAQPTLFLDGHTVDAIPPALFPEPARLRGAREMVHIGR